MIKPIYYLSYSDIPKTEGLIFPNELLVNNYSPGIWVIDKAEQEGYSKTYEFDAVEENELIKLKMSQIDNSVYQVSTDNHGKFYFRINKIHYRYSKYVGKSNLISFKNILFQVSSMDIQKLHDTCLKHKFYFVGRIDTELIQNTK